jgi:hypothetical protein
MVNSWGMRSAGHVASMGVKLNAYKIFARKLEGNNKIEIT